MDDGVQIFVAMALLTLLGVAAMLLAIPTFGLSLAAFVFFFLYAVPAVVVGRRRPLEAIAESARIATANALSTLVMTVVMGALALAALLPMVLLGIVPLAGPVLSATLVQAVTSFFTLMVVGAYYANVNTLA